VEAEDIIRQVWVLVALMHARARIRQLAASSFSLVAVLDLTISMVIAVPADKVEQRQQVEQPGKWLIILMV